jgi:hypothetical protein
MKIDFHCHSFPAEFFRALKRYYPEVIELRQDAKGGLVGVWAKTPLPAWNHDARLEDIDRAGIDVEISLESAHLLPRRRACAGVVPIDE